jgi:hypothetical protein
MKILYLAHSIHSGIDFKYEYALDIDQALFDELPFAYGISNVKVDGHKREVVATIIVKTDAGQSREELHEIYSNVASLFEELDSLSKSNVTLRCTKVGLPAETVPNESLLLEMINDIYTVNGVGGRA